jgi:hypothetical protein
MVDESTSAGVGTSIDELRLDILVNSNNASKRINAVTKSIENLNKALSKSGNLDKVLGSLNSVSPTTTTSGKTTSGGTNNTLKNVGIFATIGKWNYMINMARYYGRKLADIVQLSMDYVETQNLWQVANRNNIEMADEFIGKMNKAYGISEQTLMNYQAIFKNMLSALGDLDDAVSSKLSMQLTTMATDFASLYNVSIKDAMTKFQAVLSGQVRPIRSVSGYDITENTIFDLYKQAGGEKTMRQLSQLEKRLLRIYAVYGQMGATGATGDMAKTIESASNQARIMSEQVKETLTWTGQLILMWLNGNKVFQYVNATLMTMKEIIKSLAYSMGYESTDWLAGFEEVVDDASDAVDELTGKLLSFDKFEALNQEEDNILGIDPNITNLINSMKSSLEDFTMEASKMSDKWLKSLGYVYDTETNLWKMGDATKGFTYDLKNALDFISDIYTGVKNIFSFLEQNKEIAKALGISIEIGLTQLTLGGYAIIKYWTEIKAFFERLGRWFATDFANFFVNVWKGISNFFAGFINGISNMFIGFVNLCIDGLNNILKPLDIVAGIFGKDVEIKHWDAQVSWQPYPAFATGGFTEDGMFFANSGEMVGGFSNGKTAVANNDQITDGISNAVYPAVYRAIVDANQRSGCETVINLDGKEIARVQARNNASALSSSYRVEFKPR